MKKRLMVLGLLIAAIFLSSFFVVSHRDFLSNPLQRDDVLEKIALLKADKEGNIYLIVDARSSIVKINSQGICTYKISEGKNASYLYMNLAVDEKGNLYVVRVDLNAKGNLVESESITKYDPQGEYAGVLFRQEYKGDDRPMRWGYIKSLDVRGNSLLFHYINGNRDVLREIDLVSKDQNKRLVAYLPVNNYLAEITGTQPGSVFYSNQKGQIQNIGADGSLTLLYPNPTPKNPQNKSSKQQELPAQPSARSFPTQAKYDGFHHLYFIDTFANEVKLLDTREPYQCSTVFSQDIMNGQGMDLELSTMKDIIINNDGSMALAFSDSVFKLDASGRVNQVIDKISYPQQTVRMCWWTWICLIILAGLVVFTLRYTFVEVMRRRMSLIWKLIAVIAPIIIVGMAFLAIMVYRESAAREEEAVYQELILLTQTGLTRLDVQNLERINSPLDYGNQDFQALLDLTLEAQIAKGNKSTQNLGEEGLYTNIYKLEDDHLYYIIDYDNTVTMFEPVDIAYEYERTIEGRQMVWDKNDDANGSWMFAMAPIFDDNGNIIGILENGMDLSGFKREQTALYERIARNIGLITLVIVLIFLVTTYYQLQSIRQLRNSVTEIASGNWETAVSLDTGDEVADLGDRVNDMAENIREYIANITRLSEAYYRFVPQQFISFLGKQSIVDVNLGDQVGKEMSVLSVDIRAFYRLSESLTPAENFRFLNSFLKRMGPFIRNNEGLIERYSGSGFVALFSEDAEEALKAALQMRSELINYNANRASVDYPPIEIGIGIHQGPLMLGIIGEEQRMAGTVISDNVNLAIALNRLTANLGAYILISESTLQAIRNPEPYLYRELGTMRVEGKDDTIRFYDVFQGDPEEICRLKLETRETFHEGIRLYREGLFYEARANFIEVIKHNRQDETARIYFYLCEEYYKNGAPEGWDGTLLL
ncbi:MAG: HAMP domain-containing protein [Syntrophomonadaceae bacterium]|nr:HAMP domain-containing protein [Syntrophomonadaceae bacterium]